MKKKGLSCVFYSQNTICCYCYMIWIKTFKNNYLPPYTSQRNVKEAPSENGPTTDVSWAPDSSEITIFCGGTEKKEIIEN